MKNTYEELQIDVIEFEKRYQKYLNKLFKKKKQEKAA